MKLEKAKSIAYYRLRQDRLPNKFRNKLFDNVGGFE